MPALRAGGPRSAAIATSKRWQRRRFFGLTSWVTDHQQGGTIRRIYHAVFLKPRLLVGAHRAKIGRIGIGHHTRRALSQPVINEGANRPRTVAAFDHVRLADEQ